MAISQKVPARLRRARLGPWIAGIDEKTELSFLPPNKCRNGQNLLLDEKPGLSVKRGGSRVISLLPSGNPARDVGVFSRVDGVRYLMASDGVSLYYTTDPTLQSAWTLLATGLTSEAFMEFETAEDKIWMMNGVDFVMSWDGTTLKTYDREFQSDTDASAITVSTVSHVGLTEADDYWNGQSIVFTLGTNVGHRATVTDFDAATDKLTFTPSLPNAPAVTDRFKVGLIIPRGRVSRFWDGHMWIASTPENLSELRWHRLTDPNTGVDIGIDDPVAWPPTFQLEINAADGDRIWGISPVLRDRILVFKATGMFRIERDPLTNYTFETIERAIGSRFNRSFAQKKGLIYFIGQDKDKLPDFYRTDMVTVQPVDKIGGLEPTLRSLRQPNSVQRSVSFASATDFDGGTKSTTVKTDGQRLEVGAFDTGAEFVGDGLASAVNIDLESNPGFACIQGAPIWTNRYEADALPVASSPAWVVNPSVQAASEVISPAGFLRNGTSPVQPGIIVYQKEGILDSGNDSFIRFRAQDGWVVGLVNGDRGIIYGDKITGSGIRKYDGNALSSSDVFSNPGMRQYALLLKSNGVYKIWQETSDGSGVLVLMDSGTAAAGATTINRVYMGLGSPTTSFDGFSAQPIGSISIFDYLYDHTDYKGDKLQSFGTKVLTTTLPATLPSTGTLVMQVDYTRVPDALRRVHHTTTLNGGTLALRSYSSDTVDFSSGNDPAGFVAVANGAIPTSLVKRYQRLEAVLTKVATPDAPELDKLATGIFWLSPPIFIGQNIAAWRIFLATLTTPGDSFQGIKIRAATVLTTPTEGEWGGFSTIVTTDNIGTILGDGSPPSTVWAQLKVEQGPSSAGLIPFLDIALLQWNEGSEDILPLHGIVHKKRYLAAGAQGESPANDIVLVSDRNDAWMKYFGWNVNAMIHFQGILVGFDSVTDEVLELDTAELQDKDAAIDAFLDTREEHLDREDLRKDFRYGVIHNGSAVGTMTVSLKRASDTDFVQPKTVTVDGKGLDRRINFPAATLTKGLQRRYRNAVINEGMELKGESIFFALRSMLPNGG